MNGAVSKACGATAALRRRANPSGQIPGDFVAVPSERLRRRLDSEGQKEDAQGEAAPRRGRDVTKARAADRLLLSKLNDNDGADQQVLPRNTA